jgi:hypothetical protein
VTVQGPYCGDGIKNGTEECDGNDDITIGQSCLGDCTKEYFAECGDSNESRYPAFSTNKLTNTKPTQKLCALQGDSTQCSWPGNSTTEVAMGTDGWWNWSCTHKLTPADPGTAYCHAPSCLADPNLIKATSPILLSDDMKTIVSVGCNNVCCKINSVPKDTTDITGFTTVCSGKSGELKIVPGVNKLPAECWFGDETHDNNEVGVTQQGPDVVTACIEAQCTSSGICAKTPKVATDKNQCTAQCNSDSDCTSGKIIETKP